MRPLGIGDSALRPRHAEMGEESNMTKHSDDWRRGYNLGWRNEPMPKDAGPDMRNGWHVGRMRLLKAELDVWGVRA